MCVTEPLIYVNVTLRDGENGAALRGRAASSANCTATGTAPCHCPEFLKKTTNKNTVITEHTTLRSS